MKSIKTDEDWAAIKKLLLLDGYRLVIEYIDQLKKEIEEIKKERDYILWHSRQGKGK